MFAYLGLHPIVSVAGEVKNPQRNIPIALVICIILAALIYTALQVLFIGAIPSDMITGGWSGIQDKFSLPFKDIAVVLGLGWLATLVILDAILSPGGNGNIFMNTTSRLIYAWSRNGTLFKTFAHVDKNRDSTIISMAFVRAFDFLDTAISFVECTRKRMLCCAYSFLRDCTNFISGLYGERKRFGKAF